MDGTLQGDLNKSELTSMFAGDLLMPVDDPTLDLVPISLTKTKSATDLGLGQGPDLDKISAEILKLGSNLLVDQLMSLLNPC